MPYDNNLDRRMWEVLKEGVIVALYVYGQLELNGINLQRVYNNVKVKSVIEGYVDFDLDERINNALNEKYRNRELTYEIWWPGREYERR